MRMEDIKTKRELKILRETYAKGKFKSKTKPSTSRRGTKKIEDQENGGFYDTVFLKAVFLGWKKFASHSSEYNAEVTPQFSDVEYPGDNSIVND
jgi:L-amino acid N-acyltransferase YncA